MSALCIDSQRQSTVECNEQVQTLRLTDLADDDAGGRMRSASSTRRRKGTSPVPSRLG